jgi:FKBP-type peptidyl-prolyl cis-trans isomerase FkpA
LRFGKQEYPMTEITRVPLQPIAKGALSKLWVGAAAIALAAGGLAYAAMPKGLDLDVVKEGIGARPADGDVVFVKYTGKLADGTVFEEAGESRVPVEGLFPDGNPLAVGQMIPGMNEGLRQMQKGGKYVLEIPAEKAYGANPPPESPIPANADLTFEMEVVDIMSQADFEQRLSVLQQMMQQQQQQGGPAGGAPRPPR